MTSIYQQQIIDHYKYPRNFITIENADIDYGDANPVCGDEIRITINLDEEKNIKEIGFHGKGCAISMASASLLTELLEEMTIEEAKELTNDDIREMLGIDLSPVRLKCAILSLKVLEGGIIQYEGGNVGKSVSG
ncbi:MAG: iron-sulfur cluster assembly scaffold protein [Candidatus Kariarchaeaceae archaeon]|jgi:nitrogen fixation NifU-like protein